MKALQASFDRADVRITSWMARHGTGLLRISLGIVFLWFGLLKFFPALSPAEGLAAETIRILTFGLVSPRAALLLLAAWETLIGVGLILGRFLRATLLLLWLQMLGTITPLFLFPGETFTHLPYAPTLEGQYIIKNIVLVAAGIVLGGTVRGAHRSPEPAASR